MESDSVLISDQFSQQIIYIQYSEMGMEFIGFWEITIREGLKKSMEFWIFHTLVGWVGLKKSFSIKKIKHGLKMPKIA